MKRFNFLCAIIILAPAIASAAYDRPIPQAQSATAEIWFAIASTALIVALAAVARLVSRK